MESLAKLKSAFEKDGIITAGNASGLNDGATFEIFTTQLVAEEIGEARLGTELLVGPTTGVTDASKLLSDKSEAFDFIVSGPGETSLAH